MLLDYYIDLISACPPERIKDHVPAFTRDLKWDDLFRASSFYAPVSKPSCICANGTRGDDTSQYSRFDVLLERQTIQNWRQPDYGLRLIQLVAIALFLGTLYLRVPRDTSHLVEISGALFLSIWVVLFSVVASVPAMCRDRRLVLHEAANGAYHFYTHCAAHFCASLAFNFVIALCYQAVFFFLVGFADDFEPWVYAVFINFALMLVMESIAVCVAETFKDPMLSVTFSMVC